MKPRGERDDDEKRRDDAVAEWLAAAAPSALDEAFALTPVQLSLGMTKPVVFLANVAMNFHNIFESSRKRDVAAEQMEEAQGRFAGLQDAYFCRVGGAEHSSKSKERPLLRLSPRMAVVSDVEIDAMRRLWSGCLEAGVRTAQRDLEADLVEEEEARERREQRRKSKLKKKRDRKKGKRVNRGDGTDGGRQREEGVRFAEFEKGIDSGQNITEEMANMVESETNCTCGSEVETGNEEIYASAPKSDKSSPNSSEESSCGERSKATGGPITARPLRLLAAAENASSKDHVCLCSENDEEAETSREFVPGVRGADILLSPGIPSKDAAEGSALPSSSSSSFGSYVEAARVALLRAEVENLRRQLKAERSKHLEALQQVQLKAFISESRANAEAERADNLEKKLAELSTKGANNSGAGSVALEDVTSKDPSVREAC